MIDTTRLDSTEPISMDALQALFQANDFSTMVSRYDAESATEEEQCVLLLDLVFDATNLKRSPCA